MNTDEELIIDKDLIEDGQTVILGISGGPDSVCLFYELKTLNYSREKVGGAGNPIVCAHVNHGLRGGESDADEAYVRLLSEKFGLPCEVKRIDASALATEKGITIEEAGRDARYSFFDELCEKYDNPVIALAHNLDDQIETVFMRIMRGTGTDGLSGISKKRKSENGYSIVRPLLDISREDIEKRLLFYGETAREDDSNTDTEYFRNKVRVKVLPWLKETLGIDPGKSLLRLSENAGEDRDYFQAIISEALDDYLESGDGFYKNEEGSSEDEDDSALYLPAEMLASVHPAIRHRLIRAVFAELGLKQDIAAVHLASADRLLGTWQEGGEASGKRVEFPFDFTFGILGKKAVFRSPEAADPEWKPRRQK